MVPSFLNRLCFVLILVCVGCTSKKEDLTQVKPTKKPNIIVILTDQERYPVHWPEKWAENNLKANSRLRKHGLTFTRAYTSACECTPSRAVIYTSSHYPMNQVPVTPPTENGLPTDKELIDIGALLKEQAGYEVIWKGKWHLSLPLEGQSWTEKDINNFEERYSLSDWNPPDAGTTVEIANDGLKTLGGGFANNDGRFLEGITPNDSQQTPGFGENILECIARISKTPADQRQPFCLFISFVNPHDIWVYPKHWEEANYKKEDFENLGISLPDNYQDNLLTKPSIQRKARDAYNVVSPLTTDLEEKEYINFYAHLHKVVDARIEAVLETLDRAGLTEDTIIIRTADHGELGLSHGMREKAYTAYEEMIHIPLIISNPLWFPNPKTTDAFYSHLDLLPTIAELAGVPDFTKYGKGHSIVSIIKNPASSVQNSILFTFDDFFFLPLDVPGGHIRAIREGDWLYAVYYSEDGSLFEYEMYNLSQDPGQLHNLLYGNIAPHDAQEAHRLHLLLKEKIDYCQAIPQNLTWPLQPPF